MSWDDLVAPGYPLLKAPKVSACEEIARKLLAQDVYVEFPDLDVSRVVKAVTSRDVTLSPREFRSLPGFIFDKRFDEHNPSFTKDLINLGGPSRGFWRRLFSTWIRCYRPQDEIGELVRVALSKNERYLRTRQLQLARAIGVLEKTLSLKFLRSELLDNHNHGLAEEIGLQDGYARTDLGIAVNKGLAASLSKKPTEESLRGFLDLFVCDGSIHASVLSGAMVGIVQGAKKLEQESPLVKKCREIINQNLPDPVVEENQWPLVDSSLGGQKTLKDCLSVVKRWNVFQSINVFFKVIEETTQGEGHSHQFPKRKNFWLGYFKQNAVSEAWILLGSKARVYMRQLRETGNTEITNLRCGSLRGAQNEQSVLIMKVGLLTVVEWSHSGACRVWKSDDRRAPRLHLSTNEREDLMNDALHRITHDHRGRWEPKLHGIIKKYGMVRRRL
ncbi:EH signature domain-containing protein [Gammaproteobacteria bacterium]|nr:EH signature domain-containing protein [Gammaproteobacteria bacterium]